VVYYIARAAGYADDEIVVFEDGSQSVTLASVLEGAENDVAGFKGPCFEGHIEGFPKAVPNVPVLRGEQLDPAIFHATLPLKDIINLKPLYMFKQNSTLWDCMKQIADYSGFALFANRFGHIVYQPLATAFGVNQTAIFPSSKGFEEFADIPTSFGNLDVNRFNSYKGNFNVAYNDADTRNMVVIQGTRLRGKFTRMPVPVSTAILLEGWPEGGQTDPTWAPWVKLWLERQPEMFDPDLYMQYVDEAWKRAIHPKINVTFNAWGAARFMPYQIVVLLDKSKKTGANGLTFVITELTHTFTGSSLQYDISVAAEYIDTSLLEFMPRLPADQNSSNGRRPSEGMFNLIKKVSQFQAGASFGYAELEQLGKEFKEVQDLYRFRSSNDPIVGKKKFGE